LSFLVWNVNKIVKKSFSNAQKRYKDIFQFSHKNCAIAQKPYAFEFVHFTCFHKNFTKFYFKNLQKALGAYKKEFTKALRAYKKIFYQKNPFTAASSALECWSRPEQNFPGTSNSERW